MFIAGCHLLPYLGQICGIYPFIRNGTAMIIKVIVHTETALMPAHLLIGQTSHVPMIIVAKHKYHAVKLRIVFQSLRILVTVVVRLDLFIKRQHTGHIFKVCINVLTDKLILCLYHISEQIYVIFQRSLFAEDRRVSFSTHTHGYYISKMTVSLQAVTPETCYTLSVRAKIPGITVY